MRITCWNVNGIRACTRYGMLRWLRSSRARFVALQEVRAFEHQLPDELRRTRWRKLWAPSERPGYSGVGLLARDEPDEVHTELSPRFDVEGRVLLARFGKLWLCSAYFPKSAGKNRDNSRLPYKLAFSRALLGWMEPLVAADERLLVLGDFNVAHGPLDLARPRQNEANSGYLPEERADFEAWLEAGFVDTFRVFEPGGGHYTWWSRVTDARERNVGWRIDYVLATPAAMRFVTGAFIQSRVRGSDHCPIGVDVDEAVLGVSRARRV